MRAAQEEQNAVPNARDDAVGSDCPSTFRNDSLIRATATDKLLLLVAVSLGEGMPAVILSRNIVGLSVLQLQTTEQLILAYGFISVFLAKTPDGVPPSAAEQM